MIAVFAALDRELAGLDRLLADRRQASTAGYKARLGSYAGKSVLLCRTGMGRRVEKAARAVLDRHRPWLVLSVGLGGALNPGLRAGDLVLCESVWPSPSGQPAADPVRSDDMLLRLAAGSFRATGMRVLSGRSLTVDRLVGEPQEKDALRGSLGLDIVEMESYWVGLVAREKGLPFLAARVVLDELGEKLPELPAVRADGSLRMFRALAYALRRPRVVPSLLRTAVSQRKALRNLTRFLVAFVAAFEAPVTKTVGEPRCQRQPGADHERGERINS